MLHQDPGLSLPAAADSASRARRHVRESLSGAAGDAGDGGGVHEDVVADAEVCVSEMVTNAVLHAGTPVTVRVDVRRSVVRLEVADGSPQEPQWVPRSLTAPTGRGLPLITALSADRGVQPRADGTGKTVWCELSLETGRGSSAGDGLDAADQALADLMAAEWASVLAELEEEPAPPADGTDPSDPCAPVRLLRYPLRRGVRLREHREGALRELDILALSGTVTDPDTLSLLRGVQELLAAEYAGHLNHAAVHVLRALSAGAATTDLEYPRVPDHEALVERWRTGLEDLARLGSRTGLVTLAEPDDVAELMVWVLEEFTRQLAGGTPRPWAGPLD